MRRVTLCAGLTCLSILMCIQTANAGDTNSSDRFPLAVSEQFWPFGYIPFDGIVSHHYRLTNMSSDTVTILKIDPKCDCTHVPAGPIFIPPGESYLLPVEFDTYTYQGPITRTVQITTDVKEHPEFELGYSSLIGGKPVIVSVTPQSTVFIPGIDSARFTIKNNVDEKMKVRIRIDNDSSLSVSETEFDLEGNGKKTVIVRPRLENLPAGELYSCFVVFFERKEEPRIISVPVKINNY